MRDVPQASTAATAAARRAGVAVRELTELADMFAAANLFRVIWRAAESAAGAEMLRALTKTGNYVSGAYAGEELVGAAMAFYTGDTPRTLHSHICGVLPAMQGKSVGFALKLHQRQWALEREVDTINWTSDPLIRRNVYFNVAKLGATVIDYLPDFYGQMADGVNAADASDRLLFSWSLATDRVTAASDGSPCVVVPGAAPPLLAVDTHGEPSFGEMSGDELCCEVPVDVLHIRQADPARARRWRRAVRDTLGTALNSGYRLKSVTGDGRYLLSRSSA